MNEFFYWLGVLHAVAYALAGFSFAAVLFINWIAERFKLKAQMLRVFKRMLDEKLASKRIGA